MQPCSVLLPPSYSRPSCILLSTSPFPDPYQGRPLPLWPCGIHWTASLAMLLVHLLMSVSEPNALYMYMLYVVLPQTATVTSLLARHIQHFKPKSQVEAVQGLQYILALHGQTAADRNRVVWQQTHCRSSSLNSSNITCLSSCKPCTQMHILRAHQHISTTHALDHLQNCTLPISTSCRRSFFHDNPGPILSVFYDFQKHLYPVSMNCLFEWILNKSDFRTNLIINSIVCERYLFQRQL